MSPLWGTGLQAVQESEVLCFLRSLCPELARWKATRQVEAALRNAKVGSLKKFQALSLDCQFLAGGGGEGAQISPKQGRRRGVFLGSLPLPLPPPQPL